MSRSPIRLIAVAATLLAVRKLPAQETNWDATNWYNTSASDVVELPPYVVTADPVTGYNDYISTALDAIDWVSINNMADFDSLLATIANSIPPNPGNGPIPCNQLKDDANMAQNANDFHAHSTPPTSVGDNQPISVSDLSSWGITSDMVNGAGAVIFRNDVTHQITVTYGGTDPLSTDWLTDYSQSQYQSTSQGLPPAAYSWAIAVAYAVQANLPSGYGMQFVGHSLGGGLAAAGASVTSSPATTFNAAGLNSATVGYYGASIDANQINNYFVDGDALTTTQQWFQTPVGMAVASKLGANIPPTAAGSQYQLNDPDANSDGAVTKHYLSTVLKSLPC